MHTISLERQSFVLLNIASSTALGSMNPHRSVNLGETTPVGIPVGTIVVYAADLQHLPAQWHECDGTSFPKDKYQQLFKAIGYANGGAGNAFNIPDLQGRFIQGSMVPALT